MISHYASYTLCDYLSQTWNQACDFHRREGKEKMAASLPTFRKLNTRCKVRLSWQHLNGIVCRRKRNRQKQLPEVSTLGSMLRHSLTDRSQGEASWQGGRKKEAPIMMTPLSAYHWFGAPSFLGSPASHFCGVRGTERGGACWSGGGQQLFRCVFEAGTAVFSPET